MQSWRNDIVGSEYRHLSSLQLRVQIALLLILAVSTVGFVVMDSVLFSETANTNVDLIGSVSLFHGLTVNPNPQTKPNTLNKTLLPTPKTLNPTIKILNPKPYNQNYIP